MVASVATLDAEVKHMEIPGSLHPPTSPQGLLAHAPAIVAVGGLSFCFLGLQSWETAFDRVAARSL